MVFGIFSVLILPLGISKNIILGLYLMLKQQKRYNDLFARKRTNGCLVTLGQVL